MFDSELEKFIAGTAFILFIAQGWYFNDRLKSVHKKLDEITSAFDGLRQYLYEIKPPPV